MQCSYCPQAEHVTEFTKKSRHTVMALGDFSKYIATVPVHVDLVFAGMAEPFLNPQAVEMIEYAALDKYHQISIFTTGVGLTLPDVLVLRKEALKKYYKHFCLHLPDADGKMKIKITREYLQNIEELLPLATNLMCIGNLHPKVREVIGKDVPDGSAGLFSRGGTIQNMLIPRKTGKIACSSCGPKLDHNVLLPNGDVVLCCMDYKQEHVIGNLGSMSYAELFESAEYQRVINGMNHNENEQILCRHCEVAENIK